MAQPQAYNREVDFTERDGDDTNHAGINAELDAAALSINQIRDNLALIQRDDGGLQNGIVTADSLAPSAFDAVLANVNEATQEAQTAANQATLAASTAIAARNDAQTAETSAETAAAAALLNANTATTKAAEALASATSAASSASTATTKASEASTSATNAATSATSAAGSATSAGTSATNAAASAASALASKNAAATSETNAAASASSALASLNEFKGRYYGPLASDPTLDPLGNAPTAGDLYFNTGTNRLRVFNATTSTWNEGNAGSVAVQNFSGTGSQTVFTLAAAPESENNTQVYIGGVYQQKDQYGITGTTLTFTSAPPAGTNNIEVVTLNTLPLGVTSDDLVQTVPEPGGLWSTVRGFITWMKGRWDALTASSGSSLVGFIQSGTGAVQRTSQGKLREWISVKDFGAIGDGVANDTAAVQAAINATAAGGALLFPPGSYKVTTLDTGLCETAWFFDKAELVAGATTATTCLLKFQGHHTRVYGMKLNLLFNLNYGCALWWYNATNSSQHNDFFGLDIHYAKRGIVYGELPGNTSTGYAQSENSIYGFHSRGVERPLYMNHQNGLLFFSAPHLVAHHEEWEAFAPGQFDYTLNRAFESYAGVLVCEGGEVQNSIANEASGRCATIQGGEVYLNGMMTEVNVPFELSGTLVINGGRILNTQSITDQFVIAPSASAATKLKVSNCKLYRNVGVGSFSANKLVNNAGSSANIEIHFDNCDIVDWAKFIPMVGANHESVQFDNCRWYPDGTQDARIGVYRLDTDGQDLIDRPGIDTKGHTTDGFYQSIWYGGGTTWGLNADTPNGYYANSLEIVATGQAGYFTADPTSLTTLKATAVRVKQGDKFVVEGWFKISVGGQGACALSLYDATGAALETPYLVVFTQDNGFMSSSWKYLRGVVEIPSGSPAVYVGFGARGLSSTVRFCGLKVRRANWNTL